MLFIVVYDNGVTASMMIVATAIRTTMKRMTWMPYKALLTNKIIADFNDYNVQSCRMYIHKQVELCCEIFL